MFINRKKQLKLFKSRLVIKKIANSGANYGKIINGWNAKFAGYF